MSTQKLENTELNSNGVTDLSTNPKDYVVGDPIVYHLKNERHVGKVSNVFLENKVTKIEMESRKGDKHIVKANDPNLQSLFMKNDAKNTKTYTQFSYEEMIGLLKAKRFQGLAFEQLGKTNFNSLRLGGKSKVIDNIQLTKKATEETPTETFNVSGRFQVYESEGQLKVDLNLKDRELNPDKPIYGLYLDDHQKQQLQATGELGLVGGLINKSTGEIENFVNKNTGEIAKQWISIDKGLNKIVTRPEHSIFLDKMYGRNLTKKEKEALQKGEGQLLKFKKSTGEDFKIYVQVSAASTNLNGIKTFSEAKAKELGLVSEPAEKKRIAKA